MMRDVVALAAFPKSGVTYLSSLLFYSLFSDAENPEAIERHFIIDIHAHPLAGAQAAYGKKYIKTHFTFHNNERFAARTAKAIYLIRDPIDIMHSAYDFHRLVGAGGEEDYAEFANRWIATGGGGFDIADTWKRHVKSWMGQSRVPLILVRYEDLVDRPAQELQRIFDFLGIAPATERVREAIARSSMAAMRAREEEEFNRKAEGVFYRPEFEQAMTGGARFVNKGYRDTYARLDATRKRHADRQFGDLVAKYLGETRVSPRQRFFDRLGGRFLGNRKRTPESPNLKRPGAKEGLTIASPNAGSEAP